MTDEEREQANRSVLEGHAPHPRPEETPSDPDKDAVVRGEKRIEEVRGRSETTVGEAGPESVMSPMSDGGASATSDGASSEDSGTSSSDGGDA